MFTNRQMGFWVLSLVFLWGNLVAKGQTKIVDYQNNLWLSYDARAKLSSNLQMRLEIESRRFFPSFRAHQMVIPRMHIVRQLGKPYSIGVGGTFFLQSTPQVDHSEVLATNVEIRPHQDFMAEYGLGKTKLGFRLRIEERIFLPEDPTASTQHRLRTRFMVQNRFYLDKAHKWGAKYYAEVHFHIGDGVNNHYFDQCRAFAGIFWNQSQHWTWDIGYMNWYQQRGDGYHYYFRNILRISAIHNFSLQRKTG